METSLTIPEYKKEDFFTSSPFEWLYQYKDNKFEMRQLTAIMAEKAGAMGIKGFVKTFKLYLETVESKKSIMIDNTTAFTDQPINLECGEWQADDYGITTNDKFGFEITACNHPIMPVRRLVDIDTNIEKLELTYKKGNRWRTIIVDKKTLASNNSILQLADFGVAVNSENSKYLVKYLTEIEHLNYDKIKELKSVERLGWIADYGFAPYVPSLVFSGELNFRHFFDSVQSKGNFQKWIDIAKTVRTGNSVPARIMLASSFASVLVEPLGALPFFTHVWSETETGKTVALMLAASVWADPRLGRYIHTFNSTAVAQEMAAGFVNSLPLILDELQIIKDRKDFDQIIYQLAEGVGKARGQKTGGLQKMQTWQNCILTSGEHPITNPASGGGAVNRIIELECNTEPLFTDPVMVAEGVKKHFGQAGKVFVKMLQESDLDVIRGIQKEYADKLLQNQATEKQSLSASLILVADKLATDWIFKDGLNLSEKEIAPFLSSKSDVSNNERAYSYLIDTIAINSNKFKFESGYDVIWGSTEMVSEREEYIYIINSQFDKIMVEGGFNGRSFLSWLRRSDKIRCSGGKSTITKRINGTPCRCVCLKINGIETTNNDILPLPFT